MKATRAQVQTRVEEVLRIRLDGAEFWDVREYAREKEREAGSAWELPPGGKPLSDGQLWRYIARADRLLAESCRASRKKLFRRHLAQRRNLYAKATSAGDYRTALAVLRDEAELQGLYPPKKVAHTDPSGSKSEASADDFFARVEQHAAALRALAERGVCSGPVPGERSGEPLAPAPADRPPG
jgi:hypothetical protein